MVKARDYEVAASDANTIQAASPYAAYFAMRETESPLEVGDLLESEDGSLRICKFVGFEDAQWLVPEARMEAVFAESGALE